MTAIGNYASYLFVDDLPEIKAAVKRREVALRSRGLNAEADLIRAAYAKLILELEALSARIAVKGTEMLRNKERSTRVRPDTHGAGGPRLGDALFVEPIPVSLAGSVGVANLDTLDALPDDEGNTGWWSVNEVGGGRAVGTRLYGVFEPGGFIPSQASSREHPLFQPLASQGGEGGWLTIKKEAPARRFIEKALPEIAALWERQFQAIRAQFFIEIGI